jgi:HD domain
MATTIPNSPVALAAAAMLNEAAKPYLVGHSYRTFLFGTQLVKTSEIDIEAAFVASLLHDIGLTDTFAGAKSFELVGADAAASFLEDKGWATDRIALVEKAIVRHTELEPHESLECLIVQGGAAIDVAGVPLDRLAADGVAEVLALYPRTGFVEGIKKDYFNEIAAQPDGVFAELEAAIELSKLIGVNPLDD